MKKRLLIPLVFLVACGGPRIIPNDELALIFRDIYLINAYVGQRGVVIDSLNVYEPVLSSRGYTSEDLQYTIGSFSRRKSAHLSDDVVAVAVGELRRDGDFWRRRVATADSVGRIARRRFADTVYVAQKIEVRKIADTARLSISIGDIRIGDYEISFGFDLDSLDKNAPLTARAWLVDSTGRRTASPARRMGRGSKEHSVTTMAAGAGHEQLRILLANYGKKMTAPHLTIDSLRVVYFVPGKVAAARLARASWGGGVADSTLVWRP